LAEINLLKQNSRGNFYLNAPKFLIWFFLAVLIIIFAYYGWLFFESKSIDNKMAAAEAKISNDNTTVKNTTGSGELFTRQQQIQNLSKLIAAHPYWSQLFKPLADATLKNASYSSLAVGAGNDLNLDVMVPTLEDLDKYTQIFNLPQFYNNFSDVRISGFSKVQDKNSTGIKFEVKMQYNPKIIQYQSATNNAG
jgi:hypothetical protein